MTDHYKSRASTHADDCWSWGHGHYECAVREIWRLRDELDGLQEGVRALLNDPQFLSRAAMDAEWRMMAGND